jgi:dihydrofolate synthase/folylpolyglutamate synthase
VTYQEALRWLYGLQRFGIKLGLENIQRLIEALHVDLADARVVHVAGTNGKGSVCAMIDSIARAAGLTSALFTSPHLVTFRERIRINGEMISEDAVANGLTQIRELVCDSDPHPTFFEITTALALKHFSSRKPARRSLGEGGIDIVILETGMGGRLDATNAVQSSVSVITPIALDHQKWLGQTIGEIAAEKAGIIKSKTPVIAASQPADAEEVIRKRAAECNAPLQFVLEPYSKSPVGLRGPHQKQNAAVAIAALHAAKIDIDDLAIARGLAAVEWPARFQCWDERTVIDGAHNPASARVLVETWREVFRDQRATLILAVLADKDIRGICEMFAPIVDLALLPTIRSERAADPQTLANVLVDLAINHEVGADFAKTLEKARALPSAILITGSLHFAGEALAHLQGRPTAFEECAQ